MIVDFIDDSLTEAVVTRGWFRRSQAHIRKGEYEIYNPYGPDHKVQRWLFVGTGRYVGWWTSWCVERAIVRVEAQRERDRICGREWVRIERLPEARQIGFRKEEQL